MIRTAIPRSRKPRSLVQQQSDFTAEGSPPPGQVATSEPSGKAKAKADVPTVRRRRVAGGG